MQLYFMDGESREKSRRIFFLNFFHFSLAIFVNPCYYIEVITYSKWPVGQAAKTTPSHGVNPGSIPGQVIKAVTEFSVAAFFIVRISFMACSHAAQITAQPGARITKDRASAARSLRNSPKPRAARWFIIHAGAWRTNPYRNSSDSRKRLCCPPPRSAYLSTF